jgi:hypothetical protein
MSSCSWNWGNAEVTSRKWWYCLSDGYPYVIVGWNWVLYLSNEKRKNQRNNSSQVSKIFINCGLPLI